MKLTTLLLLPLVGACRPSTSSAHPQPLSATDQVERGRYLVTGAGCSDCHTPLIMTSSGPALDKTHLLSGIRLTEPDAMPRRWLPSVIVALLLSSWTTEVIGVHALFGGFLFGVTMHFLGQSTVLSLAGERATGEVYCIAHHLTVAGTQRRLMIAALRYADTYVKQDGVWRYAERLLYVDWIEQRPLS